MLALDTAVDGAVCASIGISIGVLCYITCAGCINMSCEGSAMQSPQAAGVVPDGWEGSTADQLVYAVCCAGSLMQ